MNDLIEGTKKLTTNLLYLFHKRFRITMTLNLVVVADCSGVYKTVSAVMVGASKKSCTRYVVRLKAKVYCKNMEVPKGGDKYNVVLRDRVPYHTDHVIKAIDGKFSFMMPVQTRPQ